ncbi:DUF86 domain-containing protein [Cyanobium sp. CH-040]|uniref:HepT-like ribonuclease domain-containing protein n=1 Tax=Cyanobium sp. CH-040 TaxID=2823708 RepID=UPI0020CE551C|nr:HepT-like ribonuclease domain-containing protein [Cyanobium sp. CH-040]MCP9928216.1 DUF86 domain-containing protein [Cyanobium sp. CH-040]
MARDIFAYVSDILEACDSIESILRGASLEAHAQNREKRSVVEREFMLIGEAVAMLAKFAPERFQRLSDGRKAIGFRNILTHNYASVDDDTVYETAKIDIPRPRSECAEIMEGGNRCG